MASNAENVSTWWRHHEQSYFYNRCLFGNHKMSYDSCNVTLPCETNDYFRWSFVHIMPCLPIRTQIKATIQPLLIYWQEDRFEHASVKFEETHAPVLQKLYLELPSAERWPFLSLSVSQMRAPLGGLSRTSGKLWQGHSSCYMFWNIKRNIF